MQSEFVRSLKSFLPPGAPINEDLAVYLNNDACMSQAWDGASGEQLNACRFKFEQGSDKATSSQDAC